MKIVAILFTLFLISSSGLADQNQLDVCAFASVEMGQIGAPIEPIPGSEFYVHMGMVVGSQQYLSEQDLYNHGLAGDEEAYLMLRFGYFEREVLGARLALYSTQSDELIEEKVWNEKNWDFREDFSEIDHLVLNGRAVFPICGLNQQKRLN